MLTEIYSAFDIYRATKCLHSSVGRILGSPNKSGLRKLGQHLAEGLGCALRTTKVAVTQENLEGKH